MELLKRIAVFGGLNDEEMAKVKSCLKEHRHPAGEVILREGDLAREMFIIKEGEVEVLRDGLQIARLRAGHSFGEMSLIDIQPRSASVRCIGETVLYSLSNRDLLEIYEWNLHTYTMLVLNIAREISRRLRKADAIIAEFARRGD